MSGKNKTILLVEDEVILAMTQKMTLEKYGYNAIIVNSGEKAVEIINNTPDIQLILMDIDLGKGIDGTEAAEIILKDHDIPVIFCSSHTEPEIVQKTEKITSYGYIVKNSGITVLDASIKMAFKLFEAKRQIGESEHKQKSMIANISDVIGIIGVDGIIKYKSPNIEKWFGWKPEDLIGTDGWQTVHPDDLERIQNVFYTLLEKDNSSQTVEYKYKCKDGSYKTIALTATNLVNDPIINGVLLNYHDTSKRMQAEDALRGSEEKYRTLVYNLPIGVVLHGADTAILVSNAMAESILGLTADQMRGKTAMDPRWHFLQEDGSAMPYAEYPVNRVLASGNGFQNLIIGRPDSDRTDFVWAMCNAYPVYGEDSKITQVVVTFNDITKRKRAEKEIKIKSEELEALNQELKVANEEMEAANEKLVTTNEDLSVSEEKFRLLYTSMDQGMALHEIITDDDGKPVDYIFLDINDSYTRLLGVTREMSIGRRIKEVMPKVEQYWIDTFGKVAQSGEPFYYENYLETTGKYYSTYSYCPKKNYFAVLVNDITGRKQAEEIIKTKSEELEALNQELKAANEELLATSEDLIQSECRYRSLLQNLEAGIVVHAPDTSILINNSKASELLGLSDDQMKGKTAIDPEWKFINEDNTPLSLEEYPVNRISNSRKQIQNQILGISQPGRNGIVWVTVNGFPVLDSRGGIIEIVISFIDITERKLAEEIIKTKSEELEALNQKLKAANEEMEAAIEEQIAAHEEMESSNKELLAANEDLYSKEKDLLESKIYSRNLIESSLDPLVTINEHGKITDVNTASEKVTGVSRDELIGTDFSDYFTDPVKTQTGYLLVFKDKFVKDYPLSIKHLNGKITDVLYNASLYNNEDGSVAGIFAAARDITERKQAEEKLQESLERFNLAIENTGAGVWDWDMINDKVIYSTLWKSMLGYADHEVENSFSGWKNLWHPDDSIRIEKALDDYLNGKTNQYEIIHRCRHKDGEWRWIQTRGDIIKDAKGQSVRWVGTNIDITEHKLAEDKIKSLLAEKELILKEVNHRIKNNMNSMKGLLFLQATTMNDAAARTALEDASKRMQSMEILYDQLYQSATFTELSIKSYLLPLVEAVIVNFPEGNLVKVEKHIDDFILDAKRLQPLGIIINELLTNIMKYAFVDKSKGVITVAATLVESHIILSVQDNGKGIPASINFENSTGFGLMLVHALTGQLDGKIQIERISGTRIVLEFER